MTSEKRWTSPSQRVEKDPRRREYLEHFLANPEINLLGITWDKYVALRESGGWNAFAIERLDGRFTVEG